MNGIVIIEHTSTMKHKYPSLIETFVLPSKLLMVRPILSATA